VVEEDSPRGRIPHQNPRAAAGDVHEDADDARAGRLAGGFEDREIGKRREFGTLVGIAKLVKGELGIESGIRGGVAAAMIQYPI
jgi:hypothetical protein